MSEVETARLLLRRWQDDDLERLVALYGDPRVARFLSVDGHPWPRERSVAAFEHFRREWQEHDFGPWAAIDKHTGRWLGQIGLNELPRWPGPNKIEVGWDLHRWFTGRPRPARPAPLDRIGQRRPGQARSRAQAATRAGCSCTSAPGDTTRYDLSRD